MAQRRPAAQQSALKVARQALQVAQSLKASVEKKYAITIFEDSEVIRTGAVFFLNETQQGLGDAGERVGDVIRMTRIRFSLQFIQPVSLTGSHAMRMVIVLDKQNVLANAGDLFIGVGTQHAPMLQYTKDYRLQYVVLYDSFAMNLDTYHPSHTKHLDMKVNINTRYIQGPDQMTTGALKVIFLSDLPGSAPQYPQVTGTIRCDYTDS
jgi:hypothetical protein